MQEHHVKISMLEGDRAPEPPSAKLVPLPNSVTGVPVKEVAGFGGGEVKAPVKEFPA